MSRLSRHFYISLLVLLAVIFVQPFLMTGCLSNVKTKFEVSETKNLATDWTNVAIGGGGYVTGIYLHPQERDLVYIRTDNGGIFRWNAAKESWIPLNDQFPPSAVNYYGAEALALDPNNPDIVYLAAGMYVSNPGAIFKSVNRGATWVQSNLKVPMGGNQDKRATGNRLVVSPHNSSLLLFGSRKDGLWRSTDAGMSWVRVTSVQAKPNPEIGILAIAFDPKVPGRIYISAYGDGIYQSKDAGVTWSKLEKGPSHAVRLVVAQDSALYTISDIRADVRKYVNGIWQALAPPIQSDQIFNGLSVHPKNPNRVMLAVGYRRAPEVYYSEDGGATWVKKQAQINSTVPWVPKSMFANHTSAVEFDPQVPNRAWLTDWFGIWRTDNITASTPTWTNYEKGHEQTVVFTLLSPPKGALLLSGIADIDGFYHSRLDTYPTRLLGYRTLLGDRSWQDTYSIAYFEGNPQYLVRVGGSRGDISSYSGATSHDGGLTWNKFPTFPKGVMSQRVAVSATDHKTFVVATSGKQPFRTQDEGATWQPVSGLPDGFSGPWNWTQPLAADSVNGNRFYYYANGTFYRSDDGGVSFQPINTNLPSKDWNILKSMPGSEGEVWLGLDEKGLYSSKDGGKSFSKVPQVEKAHLLSFGKPRKDSTIPALYLYGSIAHRGEGIYLSLNRGKTWIDIGEHRTPIGNEPLVIEASKQHFGLVFVGTNGRGIFYRSITK